MMVELEPVVDSEGAGLLRDFSSLMRVRFVVGGGWWYVFG